MISEKAAAISVSSALVSWFAENLPVLQGVAAIVAIIAGLVAIYKSIK